MEKGIDETNTGSDLPALKSLIKEASDNNMKRTIKQKVKQEESEMEPVWMIREIKRNY